MYFISVGLIDAATLGLSLLAIAALSYKLSRPIPGIGIGMPLFIAPSASAMIALTWNPNTPPISPTFPAY